MQGIENNLHENSVFLYDMVNQEEGNNVNRKSWSWGRHRWPNNDCLGERGIVCLPGGSLSSVFNLDNTNLEARELYC